MSAGSPHVAHDAQWTQIAKYVEIKVNLMSTKMQDVF
jgi:hypothetical protein